MVWAASRRFRRCSYSDRPRYRSSRASSASTGITGICEMPGLVWAASRRFRRCGYSDRPRYRSSRASSAPTGITGICGSRAWSGRHSDDSGAAVIQTDPVIVHREQARLLQGSPASVGAELARDADDSVCSLEPSHRYPSERPASGFTITVHVVPADSSTSAGTSSRWIRTGTRCARRTQLKVGLTSASSSRLSGLSRS